MDIKKGDKIKVANNSILSDCMGIKVATGVVMLVYPNGKGFSFKCDQTRSIETCDFNDGQIEVNLN